MMKNRWRDNLGLKVAALLFAIILWWTVVNIDDPINKGTYSTEVQLLNTDVLTKGGKSFRVVNTQTAIVTVKARRKVLEQIRSSNIVATADFAEYDKTMNLVPIHAKINGFENSVEEIIINPKNLQLETEEIISKKFPVYAEKMGKVREGYVVAGVVAEPQSITISGPGSVVKRINKVVATVDVSELSDSATLQANLTYYDNADNKLDKTMLTSDCDQKGAVVRVAVWRTKSLVLNFDTSGISTADGYLFNSISAEPQVIRVAGEDDIIIPMKQIDVSKEALMCENVSGNKEIVVNISEYLPEGVILANEDESAVVVTIITERMGTKSITLPVRSVKVEKVSEQFEISYGEKQEVELQFKGRNEDLDKLNSNIIVASINLENYTEEGTYDVPIDVVNLPNQYSYLGGATIQITLSEKIVSE